MAYFVLDTNVVLTMFRSKQFEYDLFDAYSLSDHDMIISVVTEGELYSLALQWQWEEKRVQLLTAFLQSFIVYPIRVKTVIQKYAEIDAYSQGKWLTQKLPSGVSARNMGKNDIWIAATAAALDATLLTLDNDFLHLDTIFFSLQVIAMK